MNRPTSTPGSPLRTVGLLFLAGLLVVALPALAQDVTVTSADPPETVQQDNSQDKEYSRSLEAGIALHDTSLFRHF